MGLGYEGTPFYLPDPRNPDDLVEFLYGHLILVGGAAAIMAREIPRAAIRAASHRIATAQLSRWGMVRLGMAEIGGWPSVGRGFATFMPTLNAIAVGYVIGAVVGTGVATAIWGEEGGNMALDFYMGDAHYWDSDPGGSGYFNIPKNVGRIWDHYMG